MNALNDLDGRSDPAVYAEGDEVDLDSLNAESHPRATTFGEIARGVFERIDRRDGNCEVEI